MLKPFQNSCPELALLPAGNPQTAQRRPSRLASTLVYQVTLEGSRGLAGGHRPDSDIDLTLIVDVAHLPPAEPERAELLRAVLQTTLSNWRWRG